MDFGRAGLCFSDEFPGRLPLLGKKFRAMGGPGCKKSASAISTLDNGMDWFFRIPQFLRSILVKWLQKLD